MRILYHAINGTGLGHLMRVANIAERVQMLDPEVHQLIVTNASDATELRRRGLPYSVLPVQEGAPDARIDRRVHTVSRRLGATLLGSVIRCYEPGLSVFDTHFPAELVETLATEGRRLALVLRKCRAHHLSWLLERRLLERFFTVVIPHDRDDFARGLPPPLVAALERFGTVEYVGPVVREVGRDAAQAALERWDLVAETRKVVLVTCGSGGYGVESQQFLERACAAALRLQAREPSLRVIAVGGPNYVGTPPRSVQFVASEPDLPALFSRADVVVSQGGYNSVHEILAAGVRAVFLPLHQYGDDQADRVRALAQQGRARVVTAEADTAAFADEIATALDEPAPAPRKFFGSDRAAAAVLAALPTWSRLVLGPASTGPRWRVVAGVAALEHELATLAEPISLIVEHTALQELACCDLISSTQELLVDLGVGDPVQLAARAAVVVSRLGGARVTLVCTDESGGLSLPALVSTGCVRVVARVEASVRARTTELRAAVLEECRRLKPTVAVDITRLELPVLVSNSG